MLVEKIDDTTLNLLLDPAVYILNSGEHNISFVFDDFRAANKSQHQLAVTMKPGAYYQVMPIRSGALVQFELSEISRDKSDAIGRREFKAW